MATDVIHQLLTVVIDKNIIIRLKFQANYLDPEFLLHLRAVNNSIQQSLVQVKAFTCVL